MHLGFRANLTVKATIVPLARTTTWIRHSKLRKHKEWLMESVVASRRSSSILRTKYSSVITTTCPWSTFISSWAMKRSRCSRSGLCWIKPCWMSLVRIVAVCAWLFPTSKLLYSKSSRNILKHLCYPGVSKTKGISRSIREISRNRRSGTVFRLFNVNSEWWWQVLETSARGNLVCDWITKNKPAKRRW